MSVKIDAMDKVTSDLLARYGKLIKDEVAKEVVAAGKTALADVKARSPVRAKGGGAYQKSWAMRKETNVRGDVTRVIIHNKKHYRLTHLLENGHQKRNGGRTKAFPHIALAQEQADRDLEAGIIRAVGEAGL